MFIIFIIFVHLESLFSARAGSFAGFSSNRTGRFGRFCRFCIPFSVAADLVFSRELLSPTGHWSVRDNNSLEKIRWQRNSSADLLFSCCVTGNTEKAEVILLPLPPPSCPIPTLKPEIPRCWNERSSDSIPKALSLRGVNKDMDSCFPQVLH